MIEVLLAGLATSIQDAGRFGYRYLGVPVSGAMDSCSFQLANALLNNSNNCACIEMAYSGPLLKFHCDTYIALSGADYCFKVNKHPVDVNQVIKIDAGDILSCGHSKNGVYAYLALQGGLQSEICLKSRSYYATLTENSTIKRGQLIAYKKSTSTILNRSKIKHKIQGLSLVKIPAFRGPEFALLSANMQNIVFKKQFTLAPQSNRMAYQFKSISGIRADEIISSPVQAGTVQLTPSGKMIVLMRDCQTTGGYARILQLPEASINRISQLKAGQNFVLSHLS